MEEITGQIKHFPSKASLPNKYYFQNPNLKCAGVPPKQVEAGVPTYPNQIPAKIISLQLWKENTNHILGKNNFYPWTTIALPVSNNCGFSPISFKLHSQVDFKKQLSQCVERDTAVWMLLTWVQHIPNIWADMREQLYVGSVTYFLGMIKLVNTHKISLFTHFKSLPLTLMDCFFHLQGNSRPKGKSRLLKQHSFEDACLRRVVTQNICSTN